MRGDGRICIYARRNAVAIMIPLLMPAKYRNQVLCSSDDSDITTRIQVRARSSEPEKYRSYGTLSELPVESGS